MVMVEVNVLLEMLEIFVKHNIETIWKRDPLKKYQVY